MGFLGRTDLLLLLSFSLLLGDVVVWDFELILDLSALFFKSLMIVSSEALGAKVLDFLALTALASLELSLALQVLAFDLDSKSLSDSEDFRCLDDLDPFDLDPLLLPDLDTFLLVSTSLSESDLLRLRDLLSSLRFDLDFEAFFLTSTSLSE